MAMSAPTFFAHFKQLKAYLADHPGASDELKTAFAAVGATFKATYSADAFKQALAGGETIDVPLEESLTSALMIFNRERATRG
jgi:hypothetical protein